MKQRPLLSTLVGRSTQSHWRCTRFRRSYWQRRHAHELRSRSEQKESDDRSSSTDFEPTIEDHQALKHPSSFIFKLLIVFRALGKRKLPQNCGLSIAILSSIFQDASSKRHVIFSQFWPPAPSVTLCHTSRAPQKYVTYLKPPDF